MDLLGDGGRENAGDVAVVKIEPVRGVGEREGESNGTLQIRSSLAMGTGRVLFRGGNLSIYGSLPGVPNAFQAETNFSISTAATSGNTLFTGDFTTKNPGITVKWVSYTDVRRVVPIGTPGRPPPVAIP